MDRKLDKKRLFWVGSTIVACVMIFSLYSYISCENTYKRLAVEKDINCSPDNTTNECSLSWTLLGNAGKCSQQSLYALVLVPLLYFGSIGLYLFFYPKSKKKEIE